MPLHLHARLRSISSARPAPPSLVIPLAIAGAAVVLGATSAGCYGVKEGGTGGDAVLGSGGSTASASGSGGAGGGAGGAASSTSSSASSGTGGAGGCPAASGGSIVWSALRPATPTSFLFLGPLAPAPTGDVYVSDEENVAGGGQKSRIYQFNPTGTLVGSFVGSAGGSGVSTPSYLGTDPLGDILYAYNGVGGQGGVHSVSATTRPPIGMGGKTVGGTYTDFYGFYVQFGNVGGDAAGHWLVEYDDTIQNQGCYKCGFDFGNGVETGKRVLRYDAGGTYLGSIPSPGPWRLDPSGQLHVVTGFQGTTDIGCGPVSGGPGQSMLLATLDLNGACLSNKAFPAPPPGVFTLGGDGSILFGFVHTGPIDLGSGPLPDLGGQNLTLAKLDLAGNVLMTQTFGGAGASFSNITLDAAPSGIIVLSGQFAGTVDLGAGPIGNAGNTFLAAFDPAGTLRWSKVVDVSNGLLRMTRQPCNMVVATDSPTVDLGKGPVVAVPPMFSAADIAVLALAL